MSDDVALLLCVFSLCYRLRLLLLWVRLCVLVFFFLMMCLLLLWLHVFADVALLVCVLTLCFPVVVVVCMRVCAYGLLC